MATKSDVLDTVEDLVTDFLHYDRKGDESLQPGQIDEAVAKGEVSIDDIVNHFRLHLTKGLSCNTSA